MIFGSGDNRTHRERLELARNRLIDAQAEVKAAQAHYDQCAAAVRELDNRFQYQGQRP